jgi:hypothetical protein
LHVEPMTSYFPKHVEPITSYFLILVQYNNTVISDRGKITLSRFNNYGY